jgi:hypothetical protein
MKRIILVLTCMLIAQVAALGEESISYTISITIPKIIEHSAVKNYAQEEQEDQDNKAEDPKTYPWLEHVQIVKTIINEP